MQPNKMISRMLRKVFKMVTIAVFKKSEQAVQLSKKISSKGFLAYVATRKGNKNGLNYKLVVPEENQQEIRQLLQS